MDTMVENPVNPRLMHGPHDLAHEHSHNKVRLDASHSDQSLAILDEEEDPPKKHHGHSHSHAIKKSTTITEGSHAHDHGDDHGHDHDHGGPMDEEKRLLLELSHGNQATINAFAREAVTAQQIKLVA